MSQNAQYIAGESNINKRKAAHDEWEQQNRVAKILLRESAMQQARTALTPEEDASGDSEDDAEQQPIKRFEKNNAGGIKNECPRDVVGRAIDQLAFGGPNNNGGGPIKNERENCAILDAIPGQDIFPDLARLVNTQAPPNAGEMGPGHQGVPAMPPVRYSTVNLPWAAPALLHPERNKPLSQQPQNRPVIPYAPHQLQQPSWAMDATTLHERGHFALAGEPYKKIIISMPFGSEGPVMGFNMAEAAKRTVGVRMKIWEMEQELEIATQGMAEELYACSTRIRRLEGENAELRRRLANYEGGGARVAS